MSTLMMARQICGRGSKLVRIFPETLNNAVNTAIMDYGTYMTITFVYGVIAHV